MKSKRKQEGGYAAIMTTIIISLVLLTMIAQSGFAGWHARFFALNREKKHQAHALANGCINLAMASMIKNPDAASFTLALASGACDIRVVDTSDFRTAEFHVQSRVGGSESGGVAHANMKVVVHLASGEIISWQEIPTKE